MTTATPDEFIARWRGSAAAELANSQSFLKELCLLLGVPEPDPTQQDESFNTYVFEKAVLFNNGDGTTSPGRVDLYRKGCFVLESKQGAERKAAELAEALATKAKLKRFRLGTAQRGTPGWEQAMVKARQQAKRYAEALPDEWPPFLVVADVGHCFDLYADFTQSGKNYVPFPDPQTYRIRLDSLADDEIRDCLRRIWLDPHDLDPSQRSAKVTREVATRLAKLAKSLENDHSPDVVAGFLMRCLFTMFAEDVEIGGLSEDSFKNFLKARRGKRDTFVPMLSNLWREMDTGGFSLILERQLKQFNGGLFADHTALPVTDDQLELLIEAAEAKWNDVEPAIFGTLLERALDPVERHKLGAHYTPRPYVERLVMPTIIEPLRDEWDTVYATAVSFYEAGKASESAKAVRAFHERLCETRVLDPACGSGNFLYVSLELLKRLEGEVLKALRNFGDHQQVLLTIDPHQFLGIEVNPRATAITDLVLWIGYLQWHFRTRAEDELREPIIRNFHNIECRDAVLAWDDIVPVVDEAGNPATRWDGRTTKPHPVTREEVPDETVRVEELRYINPRKAEWPETDYIVGNPPFLGKLYMLDRLGACYVDALREAYAGFVPDGCDFVMYWWFKAAEMVRICAIRRFGLISTKSISQSLNRRVLQQALAGESNLRIAFAVPNHPWVDSADGAAVRIAMTVADSTTGDGRLAMVVSEKESAGLERTVELRHQYGQIGADLRIGPDVLGTAPLKANALISGTGLILGNRGFVLTSKEASDLIAVNDAYREIVHPLRNGKDITSTPRDLFVADTHGLGEIELRTRYPSLYQRLRDRVYPERQQNRDKRLRRQWWLLRRSNEQVRGAISVLSRFIVTPETSRHRLFVFVEQSIRPEHKLVVIGSDDAWILGMLSSRAHVAWAIAAGGRLGVGNDPVYSKNICFERFPFLTADEDVRQRIRGLGEQLDAHRKRQQQSNPHLTMTGMYNVLEKLRTGEELTAKERDIHEKGLVSVLKQIHDDLDAAVFDAYGWPHDLEDEQILQRLVDLNHERVTEEACGMIRWLRPEFQKSDGEKKTQTRFDGGKPDDDVAKLADPKIKKLKWPATLPKRVSAVRAALSQHTIPATPAQVAKYYTNARKEVVEEILDTLVAVGQARQTETGRYAQ